MSNQQIVSDFIAAWERRDLDRIVSFLASDCVYHNIPWEPVRGVDEIRKVLKGFVDSADEIEFVVHHSAETSDGVVMNERTDRFLTKGRRLELPVMGVFEIRNGKIAAWRDYFDENQFKKQMEATTSAAEQTA